MSDKTQPAVVISSATHGQGRDLVNQLLGQAQMASALSMFSQTASVSKLAIVKESKLYQQLSGMVTPNGLELKGTWAEFCSLLGMSDEKANQDIANLQAFGEEALDQMQRLGIGYRDMRQFRKLPADQKTALIEAAKTGDKDSLLELAEELIAKSAKDKDALTQQVEAANSRAASADVDRARAEAEAEGLRKQLRRQQRDDEDALIPAAMADLRQEIGAQVKKAELAIQSMERLARDLAEMQGGAASDYVSPTAQLALAGMISLRVQLDSRMAQFKEQFDCEGITGTGPDKLAALLPFEVAKLASHWAALTDAHKHEGLLRAHERESARPRGRGRPKAAPADPV